MRRLALILAALAAMALPVGAQEAETDDKTFIEDWLEDNLSAAGRDVVVTGFAGALSSRATMQRLTVADDEGIWLSITGAELDWTRSALLTGRLEIEALTAEQIEISRLPVAISDGPRAEASGFSLPELPVTINIGSVAAERVVLGAPLLGEEMSMTLNGSGWLEDGEGEAELVMERVDGAAGVFSIAALYSNETRQLELDLDLDEGPDGIVATLTGLPGGPPLSLSLEGSGPIDDFSADLELSTDGAPRLSGQLALASGSAEGGEAAPIAFSADLSGDPRPLFAPDYRAFFGTDVALAVAGERAADGTLDLSRIEMRADALALTGAAVINADGWFERAQITGRVAAPDGEPVLLPIAGTETRVARADLDIDYDAASGDSWRARLEISGLDRPDISMQSVEIAGSGTLEPGEAEATPAIAGIVELNASGIASDDPGLSVIGTALSGSFDFTRTSGAPLELADLALEGADYGVSGAVSLETDWEKLDVIASGDITLAAEDLARFAPLTGQSLTGAARLQITGEAALPGGPFDVEITGSGRDLGIGMAELDRLFAGRSTLSLAAKRDETGTEIERFAIAAPGARAEAAGRLTSEMSRISGEIAIPDASLVAEGLDGAVTVSAEAIRDGDRWQYTLEGTAPGETQLTLEGAAGIGRYGVQDVTGEGTASVGRIAAYSALVGRQVSGSAEVALSGSYDLLTSGFDLTGTAQGRDLGIGAAALDQLIGGTSEAAFALRRGDDGTLYIDRFVLDTPNVSARATGAAEDGVPRIEAEAQLRELALLVPGLNGAFSARGSATLGDGGWSVTATGDGPGGSTIRAEGVVASDAARADLALTGQAPLALANGIIAPRQLSGMAAFDLQLDGPFALASLTGTLSTAAARVALPTLGISLDPVRATARLGGGQAIVDATAAVSSGGRVGVSGPIALAAPYGADLAIRLDRVTITDPTLYDITGDAALAFSGALGGGGLLSGQVRVIEAELLIPETGFGLDGSLDDLRHIDEPADVRATRARANLIGGSTRDSGARPYALDVTVDAPNAVFIRGRGLDAELGGSLRLGGSTADVIAQGGFSLIRGRLDILGNRLTLTEGNASLRGNLDPAIRLVAETQADDVAVRITLDGLATDPSVTFSSSPSLPEDEILSRLIFGRGLDDISPFQALRLASAVATLSGRGGAGTIGRLRDSFGLDDLDVTTDETGALALSAGTYISENIYTDVTVGAEGKAEINLNLTLTPSISAKGSVSSDGNSSIGIFFEKDY